MMLSFYSPGATLPLNLGLIVLASIAAAIRATLTADFELRVKWPNDLLVRGHKICGILSESAGDGLDDPLAVQYCKTGIGLSLESGEGFKGLKELCGLTNAGNLARGWSSPPWPSCTPTCSGRAPRPGWRTFSRPSTTV